MAANNALTPPARIGLVGLGLMGVPMARNLLAAGYSLTVYDVNTQVLSDFAAANPAASAAASLRALAGVCDAVITMLPNGKIVRDVVLEGADNLASGLAAGTLVIDMSSSSPVGTRELGELLAARGLALIDAPVSGGVRRAVDATLAIMIGGDDAQIARCEPLLKAMGRDLFRTGGLGTAHAMKALNNYVSAAGFSLGLMVKDLRTALEVAQATGMKAPIAQATVDEWAGAEALLGPGADHTAMVKFVEHLAGSTIEDGPIQGD